MTNEIREKHCYKFANFQLDTEKQIILRQNAEIHLPKRQFQILEYLLENHERVVSRNELLDEFWDGHEVYDDALRKAITGIRRALDDTEKPSRFIETRRGSGFRFIGNCTKDKISNSNVQSLRAEVKSKIVIDEREKLQSFAAPKNSFWRSRIVLVSVFTVCLILLISFAAIIYSTRKQPSERGKRQKITAIAVLPLRNLTGDATNDYLSDGLSEGLIDEFSRHSELKVISRISSVAFKNKETELQEIGEKLKVEVVLEGSLRKFGNEMWLEVSLVDVRDGKVLWANNAATGLIRNILTAQNRVVCDVLAKIEAGNCTQPETAKQVDSEAYRLYLQGIKLRNNLFSEAPTKAIELFNRALEIAPNFAKAHEAIATTYIIMESNSLVPPHSVIKKAEAHAEEALKIDENSIDALLVLSETKTSENYDLQLRESLLRQAVEKNPNHQRARMWLANILTVQGKFAEAESELLKAQELDPLSLGVRLNLGELYLYWGKLDETIKEANLISELSTPETSPNWLLAKAYFRKGDFDQAKKFADKSPNNEILQITWLIKTGKTDKARTKIQKLEVTEIGKISPYIIGCSYAQLGDKDATFAWLEKAYSMRQADLISLRVDPAFDGVRDDARYQNLLNRIGFAE